MIMTKQKYRIDGVFSFSNVFMDIHPKAFFSVSNLTLLLVPGPENGLDRSPDQWPQANPNRNL